MHRLSEPSGKVRCLSCAEADCVIALPTAQGPTYRCFQCGPVVRCRFPTDAALPERYIRSYDELTERLRAELIEEDEPEPDYEANERRISPQGCVICKGPGLLCSTRISRRSETAPGATGAASSHSSRSIHLSRSFGRYEGRGCGWLIQPMRETTLVAQRPRSQSPDLVPLPVIVLLALLLRHLFDF